MYITVKNRLNIKFSNQNKCCHSLSHSFVTQSAYYGRQNQIRQKSSFLSKTNKRITKPIWFGLNENFAAVVVWGQSNFVNTSYDEILCCKSKVGSFNTLYVDINLLFFMPGENFPDGGFYSKFRS